MATEGRKDVRCSLINVGALTLEGSDPHPRYTGLAVSEQMLMVTDDIASNVQLYGCHGKRLLATTDKLESEPCGICLINENKICVTLKNRIEIMSVKCTGDTFAITHDRILHVNTEFDWCHGVVIVSDKVIVSGWKDHTIFWCIVSLNDGHMDKVHRICKGARSYLTAKDTMIYLSCDAGRDSPDNGVYGYDIQDPIKQKCIYQDKELTDPTGITVDKKGFIFVCNWIPPCIHHLTDKCEPVAIYKEGMPWNLWAISWDQDHLFVTCYGSNRISRYKPEYSGDHHPGYTGLLVSGEMLIVTDDIASNVQLYGRHGKKLLATTDKLESEPCGICLINENKICVALKNRIEIMSVKCTGDTFAITRDRILHVNTEFDWCHGVVIVSDKVIVSGWKDHTIFWCIVSLNDGHMDTVHRICKGNRSYLTAKDTMIYLSCDAGRDSPDNGVYGYDIQDPIKQKCKYQNKELKDPTGITVDKKGFIFVCNWIPPCIHHLTDKCEPVAIYKEGMPWNLWAIFWDTGDLFITCYGSSKISQYKPEYSHQQGHKVREIVVRDEMKHPLIMDTSTQIKHGTKDEGQACKQITEISEVDKQGDSKTTVAHEIYNRRQPVIEETDREREYRSENEIEKESFGTEKDVLPLNSPVESSKDSEAEKEVLPLELLGMDESFQKLYKEALANGKEKVYNIRVMIIGHQGVGKTSLTQRLLGEEVRENETESTEGIKVHARCCQIDHTTQQWKRNKETDELLWNDQQIAGILHKHLKISDKPKPIAMIETDTENGKSPKKKRRLSKSDENSIQQLLEEDRKSVPKEFTGSQDSKTVDIVHEGIAIQDSDLDYSHQSGQVQETICPTEVKNFVMNVKTLSIPKNMSSDVTLLDFAGQSIFYTTHQAFMSWRTLYLLVTDMSLPLTAAVEDDGVLTTDVNGSRICSIQATGYMSESCAEPCVDQIHGEDNKTRRGEQIGGVQGTSMNAPCVILVGTHSDKIPQDLLQQTKESYFNDIRNVLKNRPLLFHLVDEDFAISNLGSDPNINALKSKIFEIAQKQAYWGEEIPARWIPLQRALMELKNRGTMVIDYADVKSLNESLQVRIEQPEELELFLKFQHAMGNIIFFSTERLRKKVVLDPEWLINGVRTWITSDKVKNRHPELSEQWFAFKDTGRLTSSLLGKLWSSNHEFAENQGHLLDVMEKLNIIAKPLPKEEESGEEEFYWVPCMVNMPAPDDVKKLGQNDETTKTSTLCFRSKTKFIHDGVFHRLLATCLSKWEPAKEREKYRLFRGLCIFNLDPRQQLLLSLNDFVIHVTVFRSTKKKRRTPRRSHCMAIMNNLYTALSEISDYLCPRSEFEICIKCKKSQPFTNEGLHSISILRTYDEVRCSTHGRAHCVRSKKLLGFWEEEQSQIPDVVLPQHTAHATERFTRLFSLVSYVGCKVLRRVLVYYSTASGCTFDEYMKNNKSDILELWKRKLLTQAQVDIVFPQSGQTDINQYDFTLASALLSSMYPSLGEQENEIIKDLRTERNKLVHYPSAKMSEQNFKQQWMKITSILTDLSKLCKDPDFDNNVLKEIQDIQQSGLFRILSNLPAIRKEMATIETGTSIYDSVLRKLSQDLIEHNWKFFFRELSVAENILVQVEIDHHGNVQEQIYQLLRRLNQKGNLKKTNIIQALQNIGRNDLINKYNEEEFSAC